MSRQVAKKPRSDASSNISIANDLALPVCSTIESARTVAQLEEIIQVVELTPLERLSLLRPARRLASVRICIFGNCGAPALSVGQAHSSFTRLDLFATLSLEIAVPGARISWKTEGAETRKE